MLGRRSSNPKCSTRTAESRAQCSKRRPHHPDHSSQAAAYDPCAWPRAHKSARHRAASQLVVVRAGVPSGDEHRPAAESNGAIRTTTEAAAPRVNGPKSRLYLMRSDGISCSREIVEDSLFKIAHPSTQQQMLVWKDEPRTVLLLKKLGDDLLPHLARVARYLHREEGVSVIVEPDVRKRLLKRQKKSGDYDFVQTFPDVCLLPAVVDFVVCLGGDGVILHAASMFRMAPMPPVVSIHLGSLGFLTNHAFEDYKSILKGVIHGEKRLEGCSFTPTASMENILGHSPEGPTGVYVTLRMRLKCKIMRDGIPIPGGDYQVMNELVVDRGSNPFLTKIECYEKGKLITKVQADGVMLATPTGSTAYSVAAGGSMVHPNISAILLTPICPHSLSFRPIILPDYAEIELRIPQDSRCTAWVSFDGKARQELQRGDSIFVTMSTNPVPTINADDQTTDWFNSLERCLSWNDRQEQGGLSLDEESDLDVMVEDRKTMDESFDQSFFDDDSGEWLEDDSSSGDISEVSSSGGSNFADKNSWESQ